MAVHPGLHRAASDPRRIVIVGPCASGKSTLAQALVDAGYDARVSGQEHSAISGLWRRLEGDVLIALDLDIETLRARRGASWSAELLARQHERLAEAYAAADLTLDTAEHDQRAVFDAVARLLAESSPA